MVDHLFVFSDNQIVLTSNWFLACNIIAAFDCDKRGGSSSGKLILLLDASVLRKYAAAIFITSNRFETGKKRLNYLCFDDFVFCANIMMQHWSYSSVGTLQLL